MLGRIAVPPVALVVAVDRMPAGAVDRWARGHCHLTSGRQPGAGTGASSTRAAAIVFLSAGFVPPPSADRPPATAVSRLSEPTGTTSRLRLEARDDVQPAPTVDRTTHRVRAAASAPSQACRAHDRRSVRFLVMTPIVLIIAGVYMLRRSMRVRTEFGLDWRRMGWVTIV
jgi:hypothetical protein